MARYHVAAGTLAAATSYLGSVLVYRKHTELESSVSHWMSSFSFWNGNAFNDVVILQLWLRCTAAGGFSHLLRLQVSSNHFLPGLKRMWPQLAILHGSMGWSRSVFPSSSIHSHRSSRSKHFPASSHPPTHPRCRPAVDWWQNIANLWRILPTSVRATVFLSSEVSLIGRPKDVTRGHQRSPFYGNQEEYSKNCTSEHQLQQGINWL